MSNYQLYRTNVYLGGQMKWDLVIDDSVDGLYVTKFNLTPISDNAKLSYNDFNNTYSIYNTTHEQNIKKYYNANKNIFYDECLPSEFVASNAHRPIVTTTDTKPKLYCDTYNMGCKRSRYNKYKKQFEFFCPLWLENVREFIKFTISVTNHKTGAVIAAKTLELNLSDIENSTVYTYHNKFVEYLNNYLKNIYTKSNDNLSTFDNVIDISFGKTGKKRSSKLYGIDVSTGNVMINGKELETSDNSFIATLKTLELPKINVDNFIIQAFKTHTMICKQLHNFNLCFNIDDIIPDYLIDSFKCKNVNVTVDVNVDGAVLDKVDFYTEYNFIKRQSSFDVEDPNINVYEYLRDYAYIGNICLNKFGQNICHWSLCDNNDYIFNFYNGFAGIVKNYRDDEPYNFNDCQYKLTPNISISDHRIPGTVGWVNTFSLNKWSDFYKYIKNTNKYKNTCTAFGNSKIAYINNLKYTNVSETLQNKYIVCLYVDKKLLAQITNTYTSTNKCIELVDNSLYAMYINDLLIFISVNLDQLTFNKIKTDLGCYVESHNSQTALGDNSDDNFKTLYELIYALHTTMRSVVEPSAIDYTYVTSLVLADGPFSGLPNIYTNEIDYNILPNDRQFCVYRYDGKIKPTFVKETSTMYYKDHILYNDLPSSKYSNYAKTKYEMIYPSLNYCGFNKICGNEWTREQLPMVETSLSENEYLLSDKLEYSWYNNNKCMVLNPTISFNCDFESTTDFNENINDVILTKLSEAYNVNDNDLISYIKDLYTYTYTYVITSDYTIYKYNITLTLK